MKYNRANIMSAAWRFFRKGIHTFAQALRMAWANAKAHNEAKDAAGITEETHTWSGWRNIGYEVIHESKALFKAILCTRLYWQTPPPRAAPGSLATSDHTR